MQASSDEREAVDEASFLCVELEANLSSKFSLII